MKNNNIKLAFGFVIFLFSLALGFFTAKYLSDSSTFDYWGTIAIFAACYILIGIIVARIYSISLGFLFSADIFLINLLGQYYGKWTEDLKLAVIGVILFILYTSAALALKDKDEEVHLGGTDAGVPVSPASPSSPASDHAN